MVARTSSPNVVPKVSLMLRKPSRSTCSTPMRSPSSRLPRSTSAVSVSVMCDRELRPVSASVRSISSNRSCACRAADTSARVTTAPSVPPEASRNGSQLTRIHTGSPASRVRPLPWTWQISVVAAPPERSARTGAVDSAGIAVPCSSRTVHGGSNTLRSTSWSTGTSTKRENVALAVSMRPNRSTTATPSPRASMVLSSSSRCTRRLSARRTRSSMSRVNATITS